MIIELQKGGTTEERTNRLMEYVIKTLSETENIDNWVLCLALSLMERGTKFNRREDLVKANELAALKSIQGGDYYTPILYFKHYHQLTPEARENLLDDLRLSVAPGAWLRTVRQGYGNVNIPMKGAQNCILGGEALGNFGIYNDAFNHGMKLLQDLLDIVNETGSVPEYNSPVYTGVSIAPLAAIANFAKSREAVLKARLLQEVIFIDLCSRYHEPTNQMSGPYSREYLPNRIGGFAQTRYVLYRLLPEGLFISLKPHNQFLSSEDNEVFKVLRKIGDSRLMAWVAAS
ncbi:MAG: hypothetical protein QXH91_07725, partial [Candidatus Bathyarchaeia archaeon]